MTDVSEFDVEYVDFHAQRDYMSHTLRLSGLVMVKGGGVAVTLSPYEKPTGINDRIFVLEMGFAITAESPSEQPVGWEWEWDEYHEGVEFRVEGADLEPPPYLPFEPTH